MGEYDTAGRESNGEDVASFLAAAVNSGVDAEGVADGLQSEHRWLQREVFREVLKPAIVGLAGSGTDARNEDEVKLCRQICEEMGWEY